MRKSEINTTLLEKREYVLLKNRREELSLIPTDHILEYYSKKDDVPTLTLEIPNKVRRGDLIVDYPLYEQFQPRRHIVVKMDGKPTERYVVEDLEVVEEKDVKIKRITAYGYEHILKNKACLINEGLTRQLYLTANENVHVGEGILNIFEQQTGWKVNHIDELARKEQVTENVSVTKELMGSTTYQKVDDNTVLFEKDFTVPSEQGFPLNFDVAWVDLVVTTTDGFTYNSGSIIHTFTDFHQGIKKIKATFTSNSTQRYGITYDLTLEDNEVKTITYAFANCRGLKLEVKQVNLTYQTSQEEEKLVTKYRYLEYGQSFWYEYLKTTVQEAYGVYIKFNSYDKTIDVYNEEQFGEWKGFYLDYNNLLTKVSKQPDMDELCTRLWVQSNNVDITEVNPLGTGYLEDYTYFEKSGTMSESLKNALKRYYVHIEAQQIKWAEISKLKKSTDQWLTKRNSELTALNEQVKAKQALLTAYLKAGNNEAGQKRVAEELKELEKQVSEKLSQIETLKEQSDNYLSQMQLIGKQMAKETSVDAQGKIFSDLDLEELDDITIEQTYTDDYYTKANALYDYAQTLMKDKASLRYGFSLEHKDLAQNIKHPLGWEWFIELGAKVEIADKDIANKDGFITIYAFKYSPKNKKMESVEFDNNSAVIKAVTGLASFSKVAYSTANMTDFWKETWKEAETATAVVSDIRKNGLDLASNIVRGGNTVNKISMTESGIFVIDSNNEDNQIYVGSSLIAITDDRWITSKTAIDQGGLIADTVVGRLLLGQSLFLSNEDGSFSITSQGLSIKDATQKEIIGLGVNTNNNTNHFHIGNKNDSAYLIFDENGNLDIKATSVKLSTGDIVDKDEIHNYINTTLDGIQIGARNLVLETDIGKHGVGKWTSDPGIIVEVDTSATYLGEKTIKIVGSNGIYYDDWIKLERNTSYTYSMMMKSSNDITFTDVAPLHMWLNDSANWGHLEIIESHTQTLPANTWQQVYVTFKTPDIADTYYMKPFIYDIGNATVNICRVQVEKGNKATDWRPAAEDVGFDIAISKQEAIDSANNTLTTTISNYYTKAETESHIDMSKEAIELGVSQKYETIENVSKQVTSTLNSAQAYADDKKNEAIGSANNTLSSTIANYYTKTETDSRIKVEKDAIELNVSNTYETKAEVTNKINGVSNSINNLTQRVSNAESKITDTAITNVVKQNFYTKNELTSGSYHNLINNGGFENGNTHWIRNGNFTDAKDIWMPYGNGTSWVLWLDKQWTGFYQMFNCRAGHTYSWSMDIYVEQGTCACGVENVNQEWWGQTNGWQRMTGTFVATATSHAFTLYASQDGTIIHVDNIMVCEGSIPLPYQPSYLEISDRLQSAEQKITPDAITSVVSQSFYTKTETENAITSKGYATSTQLQQTADSFTYKFSQSGGYNLVRNGNPKPWHEENWWVSDNAWWYRWSANDLGIQTSDTNESYAGTATFKVNGGSYYSFSCWVFAEGNTKGTDIYFIGSSNDDGAYEDVQQLFSGGKGGWTKVEATFIAGSNTKYGFIRIDNNGMIDVNAGFNVVFFSEVQLVQGQDYFPMWSPSPNEVYDGITTIDKDGIKVSTSKGAYTHFGADGMNSYDNSNRQTLGIRNGGMTFYAYDNNEYVGYISQSAKATHSSNGVSIGISPQGEYLSLGLSSVSDPNSGFAQTSKFVVARTTNTSESMTEGLNAYAHLDMHGWNLNNVNGVNVNGGINIKDNGMIKFDSASTYASAIWEDTGSGNLAVFGDNGVVLGYQNGNTNTNILKISETADGKGCKINSYQHWNFNDWTMYNMQATYDGFTRSSADSVKMFKLSSSSESNFCVQVANDYVTYFNIQANNYVDGGKYIARFHYWNGTSAGSQGIHFYRALNMHGYNITNVGNMNVLGLMSEEVVANDIKIASPYAVMSRSGEVGSLSVVKTTDDMTEHNDTVTVVNGRAEVYLPIGLVHMGYLVQATPNKLAKVAVTEKLDDHFVIEVDSEEEVEVDYCIKAFQPNYVTRVATYGELQGEESPQVITAEEAEETSKSDMESHYNVMPTSEYVGGDTLYID